MNESKLLACLHSLGIKPSMKTFDERKRMQKLTYLIPLFDIDIGLRFDSYNWYLHGPYNPELTSTLFDITENHRRFAVGKLKREEVEKISELKSFLGEDLYSADSLELIVSLHFLLERATEHELDETEAVEFLKKKKPYFTLSEIHQALEKVRTIPQGHKTTI